MNILPFISAFMLIFAVGSYTFVYNLKASLQEHDHFCASIQLSDKFARKLQTRLFRSLAGNNLHPQQKNSGGGHSDYKTPRERFYPIKESKINILFLLKEDNPKLEKIVSDLITSIYGLTVLKDSDLGKKVVSALKKNQGLTSINDLIKTVSESDRPLFYKLLKGTQNYELYTSNGYPCLGDFLTIDKNGKKPIHFCHASRAVLKGTFGEKLTRRIINDERHKWENEEKHIPLSKEELEALLLANDLNPADYDPLLDFVKSKDTLEEEGFEENRIKIRHKI